MPLSKSITSPSLIELTVIPSLLRILLSTSETRRVRRRFLIPLSLSSSASGYDEPRRIRESAYSNRIALSMVSGSVSFSATTTEWLFSVIMYQLMSMSLIN